MQYIHMIEDRLHDELKDISNKLSQGEEMSAQCLDNIKDIAIAMNQFTTYEAMKNSGFSQDSGYSNNSYNNGYSNARGGMSRGRMVYGDMNNMSRSRDGRSYHGGNWDQEDMMYRMRPEMY